MRWLITGGCGFIGSALVTRLRQDATHQIRILDNFSVGTLDQFQHGSDFKILSGSAVPKYSHKDIEIIVGDIRNASICQNALHDVDIVVHLAANTGVEPSIRAPLFDSDVNVTGTLNILEAARARPGCRVVFASSGAPVGAGIPPITERSLPRPSSPYGASKLAGEAYCSAYFQTFGLHTVSLRFSNVYGPGSGHKNSVVAKFLRYAREGKIVEIYGDGSQTRDFIFVEDLIDAIFTV